MEIKLNTTSKNRGYPNEVATFKINSTVSNYNDIEKLLKQVQFMIETSDVVKIELEIKR